MRPAKEEMNGASALKTVEEAILVYRRLARIWPMTFEADLAMSRRKLGYCIEALNQDLTIAAMSSELDTASTAASMAPTRLDATIDSEAGVWTSATLTDSSASINPMTASPWSDEPSLSLPVRRPPETERGFFRRWLLNDHRGRDAAIAGLSFLVLVVLSYAFIPDFRSSLAGTFRPSGGLMVEALPRNASVTIDDRLVDNGAVTHLPAGQYRRASKPQAMSRISSRCR